MRNQPRLVPLTLIDSRQVIVAMQHRIARERDFPLWHKLLAHEFSIPSLAQIWHNAKRLLLQNIDSKRVIAD